jgi:hypothetical protein
VLKGGGQAPARWIGGPRDVERYLAACMAWEERAWSLLDEGRRRARALWAFFRGQMEARPLDDRPWEEAKWRVHAVLQEEGLRAEVAFAQVRRLAEEVEAWANEHPGEILGLAGRRDFVHGRLWFDGQGRVRCAWFERGTRPFALLGTAENAETAENVREEATA